MPKDTKIMMQHIGPAERLGGTKKLQLSTCAGNGSSGSFWINGEREDSTDFAILLNRNGRRVRI